MQSKLPLFLILTLFSHSALALAQKVEANADPIFKNESELGIVITRGNTQTDTINAKQLNSYQWTKNLLRFNGGYLRSKTRGIESARAWSLGLRYERAVATRFSLFLAQAIESDRFAGYTQRLNTDLGGKYQLLKTEELSWLAEAGYRLQVEERTNGSRKNSNFARLYTEAENQFNKSVSGKFWAEYLPNFTDSRAYLVNAEASLTASLTSIFSARTGYLWKFQNQPASAAKKTDMVYTASLVAKF